MSFLPRSKTAPQTLKEVRTSPLPRSLSHDQIAPKVSREPDYTDLGAKIWAERRKPPTTVDEREDPLNIGPGAFWSGPSEEEWSWLKEQAESDGFKSKPLTEESVEDTIQSEDKLGVLSMGSLFKYWSADDHLVSPYANDEAVDEDSLYLHLRQQRDKAVPQYQQDGEDGLQGGRFSQLFLVN